MKKLLFLVLLLSIFMVTSVSAKEVPFEVDSDYVYMVNRNSNEVMYEKNAYEKMYPASMTKMMSAIVAIENMDDLNGEVTISYEMLSGLYEANASMAGFNVNETVTIKDLLYGLMLPSGAECAYALGYTLFGSIDNYVSMMNEKAKMLKMNDTHFVNPTGLHNDDHYSTCYDLSILLDYCLDNDIFYQIFTCDRYIASNGLELSSTSLTRLDDNSYIAGAKTGFTNLALRCLASFANYREEYIIISGHASSSEKAIEDADKLYKFFYDNYHYVDIYHANDVIDVTNVKYSISDNKYPVIVNEDIGLTVANEYSITIDKYELEAPIDVGDKIGTIFVKTDGESFSYPVLATKSVDRNYIVYLFWPIISFVMSYPRASIDILLLFICLIVIVRIIRR